MSQTSPYLDPQTTKTPVPLERPEGLEGPERTALEFTGDQASGIAKGVAKGMVVNTLNYLEADYTPDPVAAGLAYIFGDDWVPRPHVEGMPSAVRDSEGGYHLVRERDVVPGSTTLLDVVNSYVTLDEHEASSTTVQIEQAIAQFVGAYAGPGGVIKGAKAASKTGQAAAATVRGSLADFLGFEGDEGKIGDAAASLGVPAEYINDMFLTDVNDSESWNRFEQAVEGAVLTGTGNVLGRVARIVSKGRAQDVGKAVTEVADVADVGASASVRVEGDVAEATLESLPALPKGGLEASQFAEVARSGTDPIPRKVMATEAQGLSAFRTGTVDDIAEGALPSRLDLEPTTQRMVYRLRDHFLRLVEGGYENGAKGSFLNALTPSAMHKMSEGITEALAAIKRGDFDALDAAIRTTSDFPGTNELMGASIRRIMTRELAEHAYVSAKDVFKAARDGGYSEDTIELFQKHGIEMTEMWLRMTDEARAAGSAISLALRDVGDNVVGGFDEPLTEGILKSIDDAVDEVLGAPGKPVSSPKARKKPSKAPTDTDGALDALTNADPTSQGFREAIDRGFSVPDALDIAEQLGREFDAVPGLALTKSDRNIVQATVFQKMIQFARELYITNILSSPKTITVNINSTLANTFIRPLAKTMGAAVTGDTRLARQSLRELSGHLYSFKQTAAYAKDAFVKRQGILENFDTRQLNSSLFDPVHGHTVRNVLKRLYTAAVDTQLMTDELFKQMRYRGIRYARAAQLAADRGLPTKEADDFISEYVSKGFDENGAALNAVDLAEAKAAAFQTPWENRAGFVGKAITALERSRLQDNLWGLAATTVFPFVRTPTNLIAEMITYVSPQAFLPRNSKIFKALNGELGAEATAIARGKFMLGATAASAFYAMHSQGLIGFTGSAEVQWQKAKQERTTVAPFSMIIGDQAYPLANFAPFSAPLTGLAAVTSANYWADEAGRSLPGENLRTDLWERIGPAVSASMMVLSEAPMLSGLQRIIDVGAQAGQAVETGDTRRLSVSLAYLTQGFTTHGTLKYAKRAFEDDIDKEAHSVMDVFLKDIPGLDYGAPRRDVLGKELHHNWNLLRGREVRHDEGSRLLYSLLKNPMVSKTFQLRGPRTVFTEKSLNEFVSKEQGPVDLSKIKIGNSDAWQLYQEKYFETPSPSERIYTDSGLSGLSFQLYEKGDTLNDSVQRLASNRQFAALNPFIQAKVLNEVFKDRRKVAKTLVASHVNVKPHLGTRQGINTRRKGAIERRPTVRRDPTSPLDAIFKRP